MHCIGHVTKFPAANLWPPQDVAVVVDPADYDELLTQLAGGASEAEGLAFRKRLAWKAYQHTASYDAQVHGPGGFHELRVLLAWATLWSGGRFGTREWSGVGAL